MVKKRVLLIAAVAAMTAGVQTATQSAGEISATVNAGKTGEPITKYIYGGFIEHLGNLINYGLWSELLDDRKFYYPVNSEETAPNPATGRGGMRRWRQLGPGAFVFRHTDFLKMAAYTMALSWIDYNRTDAAYSATGLLFKLYREHFGTAPVEVTGGSPQPPPKYPVGGDQPRVNSGSSTYPVDVSAALSGDRKALTVAVVNPTESAQRMDLDIQGFEPRGQGRMWKLTGPDVNASNRLGQPPQVEVVETQFTTAPKTLSVAPISVNLYEFETR
jgi:Alpha-L-arabinofuranosidase C-terminal domain